MEHETLRYLGTGERSFVSFDTFPLVAGVSRVTFAGSELTAFCPVTRQPDFYDFEIVLDEPRRTIESKSLKLYIAEWRHLAVTCEKMAALIARDCRRATESVAVHVTLHQHVRGGIEITTYAIVTKHNEPADDDDAPLTFIPDPVTSR